MICDVTGREDANEIAGIKLAIDVCVTKIGLQQVLNENDFVEGRLSRLR